MIEVKKAILRFTRREILKVLTTALSLSVLPQTVNALRWHPLGGTVSFNPGSLSTITLVNDSSSTQLAGVPTQTFGHPFKDGDIAPGTAPVFSVSGITQPFSAGLQTYWPSGCLKFATFMLLPTFNLAANGSQTITVSSGGSWPVASSRSLGEIYDQNIIINLPIYSSSFNARSAASLSSWLNNDGNQYRELKWLSGAAGEAWKITTNCAQTEGGTADGMVTCDHYIIALNNSESNLGGYRWLGSIRQPFWNQTGKANNSPGGFLFFDPPSTSSPTTGFNVQIVGPGGSGTVTTELPFLGNDGNTLASLGFSNSASFTGSVSGTTLTIETSGFSGVVCLGYSGSATWLNGSGITTNTYYITGQITGETLGTVSGTTNGSILTVTSSSITITPGMLLVGTGLSNSTVILAYGTGNTTGTGGAGTYQISTFQSATSGPYTLETRGGPGTYTLDSSPGTIAAQAMTCFSNLGLSTIGTNNYYVGSGDNNIIPVVITGSSLPTTSTTPPTGCGGIANGGFAFLATAGTDPNVFGLYWSGSGSTTNYNLTGGGSGTITPVPGIWPFNKILFPTGQGKYNFFQGTGSITAETTLRMQFSQTYWQSSKVLPPINLSYNGTAFGGIINDPAFNYTWHPYNIGPLIGEEPGPGDHSDIGILPAVALTDFYNQSENSETIIRYVGLFGAMIIPDFKDEASDANISFGNPFINYGLLTSSSITADLGWVVGATSEGGGAGFIVPPAGATLIGLNPSRPEHYPNFPTWAFIRTGELQYLELLIDDANGLINTNNEFRNPTPASAGISQNRYGNVNWWNSAGAEQRSLAWGFRQVEWAATFYPYDPSGTSGNPVYSDGTNMAGYINAIADDNLEFGWDQWSNSGVYNSYIQNCGGYFPWNSNYAGGAVFGFNFTLWEYADVLMGYCIGMARKSPAASAAQSFLEACGVTRFNYIGSNFKGGSPNGFYLAYAEQSSVYAILSTLTGSNEFVTELISSDTQFAVNANNAINLGSFGTNLTWAPNSSGGVYTGPPAFTFNGGFPNNGYTPANGDKFMPANNFFGDAPPEMALDGVPYYLINVAPKSGASGSYTADFSTTIDGSPILITSTTGSTTMAPFFVPASPPQYYWPFSSVYAQNQWAMACWVTALGISGFGDISDTNTFIGDMWNRFQNTPGGPYPIYLIDSNGYIDARYLYQPSFA